MSKYDPNFLPENYRLMFSSLDCSDKEFHFWKFNWLANENLPPCELNIDYPNFEKINWEKLNPEDFQLVTINIKEILKKFEDLKGSESNGAYYLSPHKYYNVRKLISENKKVQYPEVTKDYKGEYSLMDGRHRLNVLLKIYGVETIQAKYFKY